MARKSAEDYLKTIYDLSNNGNKPVNTTQISTTLKIAPASVTEMLKKLSNDQYITYSPYHGSTLTSTGLKIAQKTLRKHRLLERFLHDILKINKEAVHHQACEMEHTLSDEAEESLCRLLKHPDRCPDDDKSIPPCDLQLHSCEECIHLHSQGLEEVGKRKENLVALSDLKASQSGKVQFIRGGHNVLQRLLDMGLTPGTRVTVKKSAPFEGPIEIAVRGSQLALGKGIAQKVFVDMGDKE
jgi:DtxR family transcriptional regulator, Mn-dependent transcriptional regulator